MLALVETMAPPSPRQSSRATGWAVTRIATRGSVRSGSPVTPPGTPARAGTSQVTGGSEGRGGAPPRRCSTHSTQSVRTKGARCPESAPTRMKPLSSDRLLIAAIRSSASSRQGSQPIPYTASVG